MKTYKGSSSSCCSGLRATAEEWRPTNQLLFLPQQQTVVLTSPPLLQAMRVLSPVCFSPYASSYIHLPCVQFYQMMPATDFSVDDEMNKQDHHDEEYFNKKRQDHVPKKHLGGRRCVPPRLRKEWKPKNHKSTSTCNNIKKSSVAVSTTTTNTTVMIKNIPNQLRSDYMLKFLDECSKDHSLQYDFVYLPMDFIKKYNLGYAFVNFTSASAAFKFKDMFQNFKWGTVHTDRGSFTSNKVCEITWARIQGKENLIKRFQQSIFRCDRMDFLPLLLDPPRNGLDANPSPPIALGMLRRRG